MNETLKMQVKIHGEGTPVLLVPGGLTGWKSWEPFVPVFISKQKEVISVQLLNVQYGIDNLALPVGYSVGMENRALGSTLDLLGYSSPIDIVAWSYGALISLDYALDHPEKVRSLALIEPPAIWVLRANDSVDNDMERFIDFIETFQGNITEDMLAEFLHWHGLMEEGQSKEETPQWEQWVTFRQSLRNNQAILEQRDELKRLQNFKPDVLLVKGTGSLPVLHQITDIMADNFPHASVVEMPGGHAPHIVSRDLFLLALDKFQNEHK